MSQFTSFRIYRLSIPMVPFTIATGTMDYAQNVYVEADTSDGLTGVGECSAFPMIAGETQDTCFALAKNFAHLWLHHDAANMAERRKQLDSFIAMNHTIKSAFDMLLFDLAAKRANQPLYAYLGGTNRVIETDITVGIQTAEAMATQAAGFIKEYGATKIKVKLGKKPEDDIERLSAIRTAVGPDIELRIDANQGWDYEGAVLALTAMAPLNVAFCEQPMSRMLDDRMPSLRRLSAIPVMADESVFDHHDADRMIKNYACDSINIKLSKAGGIAEALRIHEVCANAEMPNMLGGMLESRLALSAKVHVALACPNIKYYDLDTCLLGHKTDPVTGGVEFKGLQLHLPELPGIGAGIDAVFLSNCESITVR